MKIVRTIVAAVLFVACVFLATANMHAVDLVFPDLPIEGSPHYEPWRVPLFVVILATLLVGILVGGLGTLFEQLRLRSSARRARKTADRAVGARETAEQECARAREQLDAANREIEILKGGLEAARQEAERLHHEREATLAASVGPPVGPETEEPGG